jgi:hypothetical protein
MTKHSAILSFCLALLLAACQSAATPPAGQATSSATALQETQDLAAASETAPTSPAAQATQPASGTTAPVQLSGPATCTAVSRQPTPGPTEQSLFPPVGEGDWVQGSESAAVTFFEYSDFQ